MSRSLIRGLVAAAIVIVLAFVTNPSPQRHRDAIQKAIAERSPLAAALGVGALTAFVSNYRSLGVASYTVVNGKTVSVGAFMMVFVLQ